MFGSTDSPAGDALFNTHWLLRLNRTSGEIPTPGKLPGIRDNSLQTDTGRLPPENLLQPGRISHEVSRIALASRPHRERNLEAGNFLDSRQTSLTE